MKYYSIILVLIFSSSLCFLFLRFLIPKLSTKIIAIANKRSSHSKPTPSGGGLSFASITIFSGIFNLLIDFSSINLIPLICLPIAFFGLLDDIKGISGLRRFFIQIFCSLLLIFNSKINIFTNNFILSISILFFLLIISTSIINFINFMDGLDGLIAGCMTIVISFALLELNVQASQWIIIGCLITFIIFNWDPAKIFMGDIGSTFLGAFFAGLLFQANSIEQFLEMILVASPILVDSLFCVIRRFFAKQSIFKPHKLHLYQRLNQSGLSHSKVATIYIFLTLCIAIGTKLDGLKGSFTVIVFELLVALYLEKCIAIPFNKASTFIDKI